MMSQFFLSNTSNEILDNVLKDWWNGLQNWCITFNKFFVILFNYLKFIFGGILILLGILTLIKFRGLYKQARLKLNYIDDKDQKRNDPLKKYQLAIGIFFIFLGLGIIFNYFTLFLIIVLEPLPDRFIFEFINFYGGIEPSAMNRIEDISLSVHPHEKTIYYGISFISFKALLQIAIIFYYIVNADKLIGNPVKVYLLLIEGIIEGMLAGFTTCLPLFL